MLEKVVFVASLPVRNAQAKLDDEDARSLGLAKVAFMRVLFKAHMCVVEIKELGADQCANDIPKFTDLMGSEAGMAAFKPPATLPEQQQEMFEQWWTSDTLIAAKTGVTEAMSNFRDHVKGAVLAKLQLAVDAAKAVAKGDEAGKSWRQDLQQPDNLDEMRKVAGKSLRKMDFMAQMRSAVAVLTQEPPVVGGVCH